MPWCLGDKVIKFQGGRMKRWANYDRKHESLGDLHPQRPATVTLYVVSPTPTLHILFSSPCTDLRTQWDELIAIFRPLCLSSSLQTVRLLLSLSPPRRPWWSQHHMLLETTRGQSSWLDKSQALCRTRMASAVTQETILFKLKGEIFNSYSKSKVRYLIHALTTITQKTILFKLKGEISNSYSNCNNTRNNTVKIERWDI